jgi:hypothetical protein
MERIISNVRWYAENYMHLQRTAPDSPGMRDVAR